MHDIRGLTRGINGITGGRLRRPITASLLAIGLATALSASAVAKTAASASSQPAYLNASVPVPARVSDLLGRMTLPEKIGQMVQIEQSNVTDTTSACTSQGGFNLPNPTCEQKIFVDDNVGSILAGGSDVPIDTTGKGGPGNTGLDWATEYNTMQSYAIAHSRLHIPVIFGVDAVHGFGHPWQAPLFPQSIGMGATWDPSAAQAGGEVTANALRATGWNWDFAPVQDIARDNRWGRYYETWSEEPTLAAAMGAANVRGLQSGGAGGLKVTATVKHFAGYSGSINGHDRVQADVPIRELQDLYLPSYAGAINANAGTVMVDSGSVNGIPATASHYLLTTQLRDRMGFKGVVISDYGDVGALATTYHMAADLAGAAALAINAGVYMAMLPFNADQWQTAVQSDVANHSVSVSRINQAVTRILTLKFQLGLFDHPTVDASKASAAVESGRDVTLKAAQESMTLLRNQNNALPLSASSKLVVTGPSADSMTNQLGGWSVAWQGVFGSGHVCCTGPANQIPPGTTVLKGLQAADPNVTYATDQATAVSDAKSADAVVVAVGEKAYAEGLGDNPSPQLAPDQQALISALEATGKPVIVVVIAGLPLGLGPAENASAVLMAYQGSTEAGTAVADTIFGTDRSQREAARDVAVRRLRDRRGLQHRGAVTAGRPAEDVRPAALHRLGPGQRLQPALPVRLRAVLHHVQGQRAVRDQQRVPQRHGDRPVHRGQHGQQGGYRHRAGVRPPAGQRGAGPGSAAGGVHPGDAGRRAVQDGPGLVPRPGPRRDPG